MEYNISMSIPLSLLLLLTIFFFFFFFFFITSTTRKHGPKSYPIIGSLFPILKNHHRFVQWTADILNNSLTKTIMLRLPLGRVSVITANPTVVRHILKTNFHLYPKGAHSTTAAYDLLGDGIFNSDGDTWKFQRQVSTQEFNTRSLRKFVQHVIDTELNDRLLPILSTANTDNTVLDFQDILERFAFDNICEIAFGYDPAYLTPSLPSPVFATAFEEALLIILYRMLSPFPFVWKLKRLLNVGSEKQLRHAIAVVRDLADKITKQKVVQVLEEKSTLDDSDDLLSRFLSSGHSDHKFVTDIVISFILAGRDTTSAALTWFFWLLHKNPRVEREILKEIEMKSEKCVYEEVKDMVYTHASLCESMRLYPPVPVDGKHVAANDVLPDGTLMNKGDSVVYHVYAMGRSSELWGLDWAEFRPERWLEKDIMSAGHWKFKSRDVYEYPVFQAGPRVCLGKEMAFLQMKRVVAAVLRQFRVVMADDNGVDPVYVSSFTAKMKGGFPVRIEKRREIQMNLY